MWNGETIKHRASRTLDSARKSSESSKLGHVLFQLLHVSHSLVVTHISTVHTHNTCPHFMPIYRIDTSDYGKYIENGGKNKNEIDIDNDNDE